MIVIIVMLAFAWWVMGLTIVVITWKIDKREFLIKDIPRLMALGLLGLLIIPIWLFARFATWIEENGQKKIF